MVTVDKQDGWHAEDVLLNTSYHTHNICNLFKFPRKHVCMGAASMLDDHGGFLTCLVVFFSVPWTAGMGHLHVECMASNSYCDSVGCAGCWLVMSTGCDLHAQLSLTVLSFRDSAVMLNRLPLLIWIRHAGAAACSAACWVSHYCCLCFFG